MTKSIHHENQFEPSDYEVISYFDNQPPACEFGMKAKHWNYLLEQWKKERDYLFPKGNAYKCQHCGQRRVRYVVAVKHLPTGEHVCFGDICVDRLGFPNHNAFKAAMIRKRANAQAVSLRVSEKIFKVLAADPELKAACDAVIEDPEDGIHFRNTFAFDIIEKFRKYGKLSERQRDALIASVERDKAFAARRAEQLALKASEVKSPAPDGRCEVEGEIISTKTVESVFGTQYKMLVKLTNNAKVWTTIPSAISGEARRGTHIRFTATFKRSDDDKEFAYGNRPSKASVIKVENIA